MSKFGWSYPPGCSGTPFDEDAPCECCGKMPDDCICTECPECGECGNTKCYENHGLTRTPEQIASLEREQAKWREAAEAEAKYYEELRNEEEPLNLQELLKLVTPLPWGTSECKDGIYHGKKCLIISGQYEIMGVRQLGYKQARQIEDNATYLVHCANTYHELVEALRAFVTACDTAPPVDLMKHIAKACDQARAALAKAETINTKE